GGMFTPYGLVYFHSGAWALLPATMWTLSIAGFVHKLLWNHRVEVVSLKLYLTLGILPFAGMLFRYPAMQSGAVAWVLAGGVCVSVGMIFFVFDGRFRWFHSAWHLLVIGG